MHDVSLDLLDRFHRFGKLNMADRFSGLSHKFTVCLKQYSVAFSHVNNHQYRSFVSV